MPTYNQAQIDLNATSPRLKITNDPLTSTSSSVVVTGNREFKFAAGSSVPLNTSIILTATVGGAVALVTPNYTWNYFDTTDNSWKLLGSVTGYPNSGTIALGTTTAEYSLSYNNSVFTGDTLRVQCVISGNIGGVQGVNTYSFSSEISVNKVRDGTAGTNARSVDLTVGTQAFNYAADGSTPSPTTTTITATARNTVNTPVFYEFSGTGVTTTNSTTNTITYTPQVNHSNMPTTVTVNVREGTNNSAVLATDTLTLYGVKPGAQGAAGAAAITVVMPNDSHVLPTTAAGTVTYTGSGTTIQVYEGNTLLNFVSTLTSTATTGSFTVTASVSSGTLTTIGSISGQGLGTTATVGNHDGLTTDSATITYTINVRRINNAGDVTITRVQSLGKSNAGTNARSVDLTVGTQAFNYAADGSTPSPTTTTITATARNTVNTPVFYEFSGTGVTTTNSTTNTITYTPQVNHSNMPTTVTVNVREGTNNSAVLATDTLTLYGVKPGAQGAPAKTVSLTSTSQVFAKSKSGTPTPATITLTAVKQNTTAAANWTTSPAVNLRTSNGTIIGTTANDYNTVYLYASDLGTNTSVTVTVTCDSIVDTQTFSVVNEGSDAVVAQQTNEAHTLPASSAGVIPSGGYAGSGTNIRVFEGSTDLLFTTNTPSVGEFTITDPPIVNPSGAITPGTFSVSVSDPLQNCAPGLVGKFFNGAGFLDDNSGYTPPYWRSVAITGAASANNIGNIGTLPLDNSVTITPITPGSRPAGIQSLSSINYTSVGTNAANYGFIAIGYFKPPQTGNYYFELSSDDYSAVWVGEYAVGTNNRTLTNATTVANGGTNNVRNVAVSLNQNNYYAIRIVHEEGFGVDNFSFKWRSETGTWSSWNSDLSEHFKAPPAINNTYNYVMLSGTDPYYNSVTALLKFDTVGSTFTDSSYLNRTITRVGSTTQSSISANPIGSTVAGYFNGTTDYLKFSGSIDPLFSGGTSTTGTTPWTLECWVYVTDSTGGPIFSRQYGVGAGDATAYNIPVWIGLNNSSELYQSGASAGLYPVIIWYTNDDWKSGSISETPVSLNTWTHLAFVFTGSAFKIFKDGVDVSANGLSNTALETTSYGLVSPTEREWYVGTSGLGGAYFKGYIDELRITKGVARYTAAFTRPSAPFAVDTVYKPTIALGQGAGGVDVSQHSNMTVDSATITYPITARRANGISTNLSLIQTLTKSKAGAQGDAGSPGSPGSPAKSLSITCDRQSFTYDGTNAASPASQTAQITLNAQNLTGTASVTYQTYNSAGSPISGGSGTITPSSNIYSFTITTFGSAQYVTITATQDSITDKVTIVRVKNGADGSATPGSTGPRNATGYLYYNVASGTSPGTPAATSNSFDFSTGNFAANSVTANWTTTFSVPATDNTANVKYWASRYTVSEATFGGTQTIAFTTPFIWTNFDGLVTFTNLAGGKDASGNVSKTLIDGASIKTGSITTNSLTVTGFGDSAILNAGFEEPSVVNNATDSTLPAKWVRGTGIVADYHTRGNSSQYLYRDISDSYSGAASVVFNAGANERVTLYSDLIPVAGGDAWYVSCRIKSLSPTVNSTGIYVRLFKDGSGWTAGGLATSQFTITGLTNNNLATPVNGLAIGIAGGSSTWSSYQNLPEYLSGPSKLATVYINDTNGTNWTIPACRAYMLRAGTGWADINNINEWTLYETGKSYIAEIPNNTNVYYKDFTVSTTYSFDTTSAMYIFVPNNNAVYATLGPGLSATSTGYGQIFLNTDGVPSMQALVAPAANSGWAQFSGQGVIPNDWKYARVAVLQYGDNNGTGFRLDEIEFKKATGSAQIASLNANKITAGQISVGQLQNLQYGENLLPDSNQSNFNTWSNIYNPHNAVVNRAELSINNWTTSSYALSTRDGLQSSYIEQKGRHSNVGSDLTLDDRGNTTATDIAFGECKSPEYDMAYTVSVLPGQRMIASVYAMTHRCRAQVYIRWHDSTGADLGITYGYPGFGTSINGAGAALSTSLYGDQCSHSIYIGPANLANELSLFGRIYCYGTAPATAVACSINVRKYNTFVNEGDSYLWVAAPMIERARGEANTPSPYSPGPTKYGYPTAAGNLAPLSDFKIPTGGFLPNIPQIPAGWSVYNNAGYGNSGIVTTDSSTPYGNNYVRLTANNNNVTQVFGLYTSGSFTPGNGIRNWEVDKPYVVSCWARSGNAGGLGSYYRKLTCLPSNTGTKLIRTISNPMLTNNWQYYAWVIKQPTGGNGQGSTVANNPGQLFLSWDPSYLSPMDNPIIDISSPMVNYGEIPQQWSLRKETILSSNISGYFNGQSVINQTLGNNSATEVGGNAMLSNYNDWASYPFTMSNYGTVHVTAVISFSYSSTSAGNHRVILSGIDTQAEANWYVEKTGNWTVGSGATREITLVGKYTGVSAGAHNVHVYAYHSGYNAAHLISITHIASYK
jgi:hypothetical protein